VARMSDIVSLRMRRFRCDIPYISCSSIGSSTESLSLSEICSSPSMYICMAGFAVDSSREMMLPSSGFARALALPRRVGTSETLMMVGFALSIPIATSNRHLLWYVLNMREVVVMRRVIFNQTRSL
jgi:hypothetical protein